MIKSSQLTSPMTSSPWAIGVIYGCYSRREFEETGDDQNHTDRLMFVFNYRPAVRLGDWRGAAVFPPDNPPWKPGDSLIHYQFLETVNEFHVAQQMPIVFFEKTDTGHNPCCDGGSEHRSRAAVGFLIDQSSATEVLDLVTNAVDNGIDDEGAGGVNLVTSTLTFLPNRILREGSMESASFISASSAPASRKESRIHEEYLWDGNRYILTHERFR